MKPIRSARSLSGIENAARFKVTAPEALSSDDANSVKGPWLYYAAIQRSQLAQAADWLIRILWRFAYVSDNLIVVKLNLVAVIESDSVLVQRCHTGTSMWTRMNTDDCSLSATMFCRD